MKPTLATLRRTATMAVAGLLLLGVAGCGGGPAPTDERQAAAVFAPKLTVSDGTREFVVADATDEDVTLRISEQVPELSGVEEDVSEAFAEEYEAIVTRWTDELEETVAGFAAADLSCRVAVGCEIPIEIESTIAEIHEDSATVTATSRFQLGTTSASLQAESFTIDLRTGAGAELTDFVDPTDPAVREEIAALAAAAAASNPACSGQPLAVTEDTSWSPTAAGIVLTWDQRSVPNACGSVQATLPWKRSAAPTPTATPEPEPMPLAIPGCETLVSAGTVDAMMLRLESSESGNQLADTLTGTSAKEAMGAAAKVTGCTYWPARAGDTLEVLIVSELDAATRDRFLAALRASVYAEAERDGALVFTHHVDAGRPGSLFSRHVLDGRTWISLQGNTGVDVNASLGMAFEALDALRAANPGGL